VLVKGALFLLVGVVAATGAARLRWTLALAAVLAAGLGGLPFTGGAIAKYAVKDPLGDGWAATAALVSAVGTTLLMLHFLRRVAASGADRPDATAPAGLALPWLAMAFAALVLPWVLYAALPIGDPASALTTKALWATLWPVLVGGVLLYLLARVDTKLPRIPQGDIAVVIDGALRRTSAVGIALVRVDGVLRGWPVASALLAAIAVALAAALAGVR
jgi:multicomponent Na+:H+ antiporter subunit A